MSISTPAPSVPPKKSGLGCFGIGCLILALLAILFFSLIGATGYVVYSKAVALTSATPPAIPAAATSDDVYLSVRQKISDFDHDVKNHQAATIQLSGDEINAMIAHNPDAIKNNVHAFVSLTNSEGRIQASLPTDALSHGWLTGRYFNFDTSFTVAFDPEIKAVNLAFNTLKFGDKVVLDQNSINDPSARSIILSYTGIFNQNFNAGIRKSPDGAALLDQAKSIVIQDGQLVISTQ